MRIIVADDHSLFRDGIVSLLEAGGYEVVGQAGDGQAAIDIALELRPDLVLLDIAMPKMSGLEALQRLRTELPETKVVMLTVSDEDKDLFEAIKAGAHGYLLKSLHADEFIHMLEGLSRGEAAVTRKTAMRLMEGYAKEEHHPASTEGRLTERELELLNLVGQGLSNKAIAHTLSISENTVKYHMKNILQKLDARNRTEAVSQAIRAGIFNPSAET
jgi:DNA-binding NarL/FixJ family response regulator